MLDVRSDLACEARCGHQRACVRRVVTSCPSFRVSLTLSRKEVNSHVAHPRSSEPSAALMWVQAG